MTVTDPRDLDVETATPDEAAQIHALRTHLVDWLAGRGIEQWHHDDVSEDDVREEAGRGEWYVLRHPEFGVGAAMRLTAEDPAWAPDDTRAVYVHGLMVHRDFGGNGLGGRMLAWVSALAGDLGADLLRADCNEPDQGLRTYSRDQGFTEVGRRDVEDHRHGVVLLQKAL